MQGRISLDRKYLSIDFSLSTDNTKRNPNVNLYIMYFHLRLYYQLIHKHLPWIFSCYIHNVLQNEL